MRILGLSCYYHDSAAALLSDGEIIAAAEEERFTRKKHDSSFPNQSILYCLNYSKLKLTDIDAIVFYDKPLLKFDRLLETFLSSVPSGFRAFVRTMPIWLKDKLYLKKKLRDELREIDQSLGKDIPIYFSEHHLSHAASAFYPSPFNEAAIMCIDGVGEWASTSCWVGEGNQINPLFQIDFPHSLGLLYSTFTGFLGFTVNSGEYKMMGLAPYGRPHFVDLIKKELIHIFEDGSYQLNMQHFDFVSDNKMYRHSFSYLFNCLPRLPNEPIKQVHKDIAASIQKVLEECILNLAKELKKETNSKNLVLAGGVALNCVANGMLLKSKLFEKIWIQPASGDSGGALGCALAFYFIEKKLQRNVQKNFQKGSLLGPEFNFYEIKTILDNYSCRYEIYLDSVELDEVLVRDHLIHSKVVGFFQGRLEFGPRALGSRSIIGDARDKKMQSLMNLKIKKRESFRPFAPIVLKEHVCEYFDWESENESPYMLFTAQTKNLNLPAVTHVDGSARLQIVDADIHPRLHQLLSIFYSYTQCPVLINTSFNVRGEPLVLTPFDALKCFLTTEMDILVLGSFILRKEDQKECLEKFEWRSAFHED